MPPQPSFEGLFISSSLSSTSMNATSTAAKATTPTAAASRPSTSRPSSRGNVSHVGGGLTSSLSPRSLSATIAHLTNNVPPSQQRHQQGMNGDKSVGTTITQLEEQIHQVRMLREMMERRDDDGARQYIHDMMTPIDGGYDNNNDIATSSLVGASTRLVAPSVPAASPTYAAMLSSITGTPDDTAPSSLAAMAPLLNSNTGGMLLSSLSPSLLSSTLSSLLSMSSPSLLSSSGQSFPLAMAAFVDTKSLDEVDFT
jgi:Spy/CpxP family protein refolding chaperone